MADQETPVGKNHSILVTGDVITDVFIYEGRQRRRSSAIPTGALFAAVGGGAALLADLLDAVTACRLSTTPESHSTTVKRGFSTHNRATPHATCYHVMKAFQTSAKCSDLVWRISEIPGSSDGPSTSDDATTLDLSSTNARSTVVIDDAGLEFRRWPCRHAWPRFLVDKNQLIPDWIILKTSAPITAGDLWHTLVSGQTQEPLPQTVHNSHEMLARTIIVVSIDDIRIQPVHVMRRLSWERTALDLVHELQNNHALADLKKARFVVINLGTDGALIAEFPRDGANPRFRLLFDPARLEGDFSDTIAGTMSGCQTCLTASIAAHITGTQTTETDTAQRLEHGVHAGLCAMRRLLLEGHGPVTPTTPNVNSGFPHKAVAAEICLPPHDWSFGITSIPENLLPSDNWTIIAGHPPRGTKPLWGLARRVALQGVKQLTQTPYLQFGKLFSVERTEIERLRALQRLLVSYQNDLKASRPLSIAVFGPPGSGKSFGVKALARAVFGEKVPLLEFNLSQFQDPSELHGLFHQVRDCVLSGRLPVVFWDEFDSQGLKWLQYFLAPMQDGTFQDGQVTHPIGKCVFVFAGGTRFRFQDFGQPPVDAIEKQPESLNKRKEFEEKFAALKGPDFKSRLAGYLDVLGPNQRDENDLTFPVRRALLLRVHLGVSDKAPLTIDSGLLSAFLEIDQYRNGARSLEKIAEQIRLAGNGISFTRSDLPARNQIDLHVDAEKFIGLIGGSL